jgi:hypothetical protein
MVPSQQTSSNRSRWRPYDETDINPMRTKVINRIILFSKNSFFFYSGIW